MSIRFARTLIASAIALLCLGAHAAPPAGTGPAGPFRLGPEEYYPVSKVRPGMKGYGLTVFKGVKIERFDVEVVGVMPQGDLGRPLVLVMLKGGPMTSRHANLIQGMSGSPIYLNGKLLGAFAMGESTGREPMGMVRPIEDMVDAFDPRLPDRPLFASASPFAQESESRAAATPFRLQPIMLTAAGASARTVHALNEALQPLGAQVVAAPGGAPSGASDAPAYFPKQVPLVPGASLAVSLMQGDVDLTAIGVVTYRNGNRILAFGHPFLQLGPAEYPASTAYIHDVFSSSVISHKYGSPIRTVGTIQQDGPFAIGGLLHRMPEMVPLTVRVSDSSTGRNQTFHIRIVNHPQILPSLIRVGAEEVVNRVRTFPGDSMARVEYTITPKGYAPITRRNTVFHSTDIGGAALQEINEAVQILSRNPFEPIPIKSVAISVDISAGRHTAVIQRAWLEKNKVHPGDTLTVQALIKPHQKPVETRTVRVKIPESAATGAAQLVVYGGQTGNGQLLAATAPPSGAAVATSTMTANVKQLIARYLDRATNDELGADLLLPGSVVSVDGEQMNALPDTLVGVMKSTKASNTRLERESVRIREKTPYALVGSQTLNLTIERRSPVRSGAPASDPAAVSASELAAKKAAEKSATNDDSLSFFDAPARVALAEPAPAAPGVTIAVKAAEPAPEKKEGPPSRPVEQKVVETPKVGDGPGRVARSWKQLGKGQFGAGKLQGVTVNSAGDVRLTATMERVVETKHPYIWSLLPLPGGEMLAGAGDAAEILKVGANGDSSVFAKMEGQQVLALARTPSGDVYAGVSPTGVVWRLTPGEKPREALRTGQRYVLALAADGEGNVYAGTGPEGRVFVIPPSGGARELVRLPVTSVTSLLAARDGSLLAGVSPDGAVYHILGDGTARAVHDTAEATVTALADAGDDGIVIATAPSSRVYRVAPQGALETLLEKTSEPILALARSEDGTIYAASGSAIHVIAPDKITSTLDNDDQNQFVSLALDASGALYAGSANTGIVYRAKSNGSGTLLSSVHDATSRSRWGRLEYLADVPEGAGVEMQTRTGDVAQPDATWSDWSPVIEGRAGAITSPPSRFIQYRATLKAAPDGATPTLHWVLVRYLTDNRPPTVKFTEPKDGDRWSGKKAVKWTGSDPDADQLTYTLYASADGGRTWKPLTEDAAEKPAKPESAADEAAEVRQRERDAETMKRVEAELERHASLSSEVRAGIAKAARTVIGGDNAKSGTAPNGSSTSFNWDTSHEEDGIYRLKVVATDKPSNPVDALEVETISGPLILINAKPTIAVNEAATRVSEDRVVTLEGTAASTATARLPGAAILKVSWRVGGGDWLAAAPADGIFDGPEEGWKVVSDPLSSGEHTVEVKATDEMDNSSSATVKVRVP